jgi:hypothetical protein
MVWRRTNDLVFNLRNAIGRAGRAPLPPVVLEVDD